MGFSSTYTDIANMALDWCGASLSIDDINNENNPDAILCKRNMQQAINTELDKYEWAFARRTITPEMNEDEECQKFGYICYDLPRDFGRLSMYTFFDAYRVIPNEYAGHSYLLQNGHLYVRHPICKLNYVSNIVPVTTWPSIFKDVVALNLAQRIATKIQGTDADVSFLISLYREKLKDARRMELIQTEAQHGGESILQRNRIVW